MFGDYHGPSIAPVSPKDIPAPRPAKIVGQPTTPAAPPEPPVSSGSDLATDLAASTKRIGTSKLGAEDLSAIKGAKTAKLREMLSSMPSEADLTARANTTLGWRPSAPAGQRTVFENTMKAIQVRQAIADELAGR
jgi:hypothetical protein